MLSLRMIRVAGAVLLALLFCSKPVEGIYLELEVKEPDPAGLHGCCHHQT